jgi:hypothetical protein
MADHRVHRWAAGKLDRAAVVGVATARVDAAGPLVGCFQVAHNALPVKDGVAGVQQRGADTLALPVRADGKDGQVVVLGTGQMAGMEFPVEGDEPPGPPAGDPGHVLVISIGRARQLRSSR